MSRCTASLALLALVAAAAAQGPFIAFMAQDLHTGFDLKSQDGKPFTKVCGGQAKVAEACVKTPGCEAFTFGGEGDCGYLKSSGNQPARYLGGLVPTNGKWSTYILPRLAPRPGAGGGGGGAGAGGAGGSRPAFCKVKAGPFCCWTGGSKYNTCSAVALKPDADWDAKQWGVKDWSEYLKKQCGGTQPWEKSFDTKTNCCKDSFGQCSLGPGSRNCWVPVGRSNKCKLTADLGECKLPIIQGFYTEEECLAY